AEPMSSRPTGAIEGPYVKDRFAKKPRRDKPANRNVAGSGTAVAEGLPPKPILPKSVRPPPSAEQSLEIVLVSIVTAPFSAIALPQMIVSVVLSVMLWSAMRLPANAVEVPSVAELPMPQNTPVVVPPLITFTADALAVVSVLP